jgi:hypothetical protein
VSATVSTAGGTNGHLDAVVLATLEFPGGGIAQLVQSRVSPGAGKYFEVRADTQRSSFRASYGGRARLSVGLYHSSRPHLRTELGLSGIAWREAGSGRTPLAKNPRNALVYATRVLLERTLQGMEHGRVPVSATRARDVLGVIAACYMAAADGRRVELTSDPLVGLRSLALGAAAGSS